MLCLDYLDQKPPRNSILRTTESILKNIQPDTELLLNIDVDR